MKKARRLLLLASMVIFSVSLHAQLGIQAGGGLAFGTIDGGGIGLQANSHFEFTEEWEGSFSFTFFFAEENFNIWTIDFDAHYVFEGGDGLYFWPQAGINITSIKVDIPSSPFFPGSSVSDSEVGLSIGGGVEYEFNESVSGVGGAKLILSSADQFILSGTILYRLQ